MEKSIEVRLQHFAEHLGREIHDLESNLLAGQSAAEEKRDMIMSEAYQEILDEFESIFSDILYTKS